MEKKQKKDYLTVSIHLKVDGVIKRTKKKTYYGRGSETYCYTLDDFASTIFHWEKMFSPHSTYAYDGLLQQMEKKLPKKDGETAESVFQKYWVNLKQTINKDFEDKNKGEGAKEYAMFPVEGDYLKFLIASNCQDFNNAPLPVKYGFLHWFFKYVMHGSIEEFKADLNNIPEEIKKLVDTVIVKQSKKKSPAPKKK